MLTLYLRGECDEDPDADKWRIFYRGDSLTRAQISETEGFMEAGVGFDPNQQFGPGLYISSEEEVGERYGKRAARDYGAGALLYITIQERWWKMVKASGNVLHDVPISNEPGLQTFIPMGVGFILFDVSSEKYIAKTY